jgi:hypothetical protein
MKDFSGRDCPEITVALPNAAINTGVVADLGALTVPSAQPGDTVICTPLNPIQVAGPALTPLCPPYGVVTAAGVVHVYVGNPSAGNLTPLANTIRVMVLPQTL